MSIYNKALEETVARALREDIGDGDVTTKSTIDPRRLAIGRFVSKSHGVAAGIPVAKEVVRQVDESLNFEIFKNDGSKISPGDVICTVQGSAWSVLTSERVALNFMQRLSGIATLTSQFVDAVAGLNVRIVDTRKTTPGLRALEKYAVKVGGGSNHRMGLYDAVMIKDNHIVAAGGIGNAVRMARKSISHTMTITVECEDLNQVMEALNSGADILLLDNMTNEMRSAAVELVGSRAKTEASGGICLETVRAVAATGIDIISVGALTHSAMALDISLDLELIDG